MKLVPVDSSNETHLEALYDLLAERTPEQSISHKEMPSWGQHERFVRDMTPKRLEDGELYYIASYEDWCLICIPQGIIGAVYLTRVSEIGVSLFGKATRLGLGLEAVRMMMEKHGHRRYLANINPANEASRKMFEALGFKHIQDTYELVP